MSRYKSVYIADGDVEGTVKDEQISHDKSGAAHLRQGDWDRSRGAYSLTVDPHIDRARREAGIVAGEEDKGGPAWFGADHRVRLHIEGNWAVLDALVGVHIEEEAIGAVRTKDTLISTGLGIEYVAVNAGSA